MAIGEIKRRVTDGPAFGHTYSMLISSPLSDSPPPSKEEGGAAFVRAQKIRTPYGFGYLAMGK